MCNWGLGTGAFWGRLLPGRRPVTYAANRLAGCSDPTRPSIKHARGYDLPFTCARVNSGTFYVVTENCFSNRLVDVFCETRKPLIIELD